MTGLINAGDHLNLLERLSSEIQTSCNIARLPQIPSLQECTRRTSGPQRALLSSPELHKRVSAQLIALEAHESGTNESNKKADNFDWWRMDSSDSRGVELNSD